MNESDFVSLVNTVATHIAREDERDEIRDKLFDRMDKTLAQLKIDSGLLMAKYNAELEAKRLQEEALAAARKKKEERWEKIRTSVLGWVIVGTLGWFVTTGVAVVKGSSLLTYITSWLESGHR
jgi:biotin carboxyl carrier protein